MRTLATALGISAIFLFARMHPALAQCIVSIMGPISVEGSPATAQQLFGVWGVASDTNGGFFVSDFAANRILRVFSNGTMVSAMGVNRNIGGSTGNGGPGTAALLSGVSSLSADGSAGVFIADRSNQRSGAYLRTVQSVALLPETGRLAGLAMEGACMPTF